MKELLEAMRDQAREDLANGTGSISHLLEEIAALTRAINTFKN